MKKQTIFLTVTMVLTLYAVGLSIRASYLFGKLEQLAMINATGVLSLCNAFKNIETESIRIVDKEGNILIEIGPDSIYGTIIEFVGTPYSKSASRFLIFSGEKGSGFEMYGPDNGVCRRTITDFPKEGQDMIENIDFITEKTPDGLKGIQYDFHTIEPTSKILTPK